jgi:hypothetical protein
MTCLIMRRPCSFPPAVGLFRPDCVSDAKRRGVPGIDDDVSRAGAVVVAEELHYQADRAADVALAAVGRMASVGDVRPVGPTRRLALR